MIIHSILSPAGPPQAAGGAEGGLAPSAHPKPNGALLAAPHWASREVVDAKGDPSGRAGPRSGAPGGCRPPRCHPGLERRYVCPLVARVAVAPPDGRGHPGARHPYGSLRSHRPVQGLCSPPAARVAVAHADGRRHPGARPTPSSPPIVPPDPVVPALLNDIKAEANDITATADEWLQVLRPDPPPIVPALLEQIKTGASDVIGTADQWLALLTPVDPCQGDVCVDPIG